MFGQICIILYFKATTNLVLVKSLVFFSVVYILYSRKVE